MRVTAVDKDDPQTDNAMIRYRIKTQMPQTSKDVFAINLVSGAISVIADRLDREVKHLYGVNTFPRLQRVLTYHHPYVRHTRSTS